MADLGFKLEPQQPQPCSTATECSQLAYLADIEHHRVLRRFLESHFAAHPEDRSALHYEPGPVKTPASVAAKMKRLGKSPNEIPDYVRSRIVADNPQALDRMVDQLRSAGLRFTDVADYVSNPYEDGFRAVNIKLVLPKSGFTGELQIVPSSTLVVGAASHANYEELRSMPKSGLTPVQVARVKQLTAESRLLEDVAASQHGFSSMLDPSKAPLHDVRNPQYRANFLGDFAGQEPLLDKYLDPAFKLPPAPQSTLSSRVASSAESGLARAERLYDRVGRATGSQQAVEKANQALSAATLGLSNKAGDTIRSGVVGLIQKAAPFLHKVGLLQIASFAGRALPIAGAAVGAAHGIWETGRHAYEGDIGKATAAFAGGTARTFFGLGGAAGLAYGEASYEAIRQGMGRLGDQLGRDWWVAPSLPVAVGQAIKDAVIPSQPPTERAVGGQRVSTPRKPELSEKNGTDNSTFQFAPPARKPTGSRVEKPQRHSSAQPYSRFAQQNAVDVTRPQESRSTSFRKYASMSPQGERDPAISASAVIKSHQNRPSPNKRSGIGLSPA
ncbi:hypothetical protein A33M_0630 [Rhodovulum sp. PH10]|uniref:RelA/SpoT domain-containing protein n=1 Tax=Rhodovulum sp. PH10 TaxID=1187851 RepID=UPI00027C2AD0|nr:RelA/SpoT domain-containing protein [Rhodovulum sp. PH10]EJW10011.1 hypothetical protein A33M_0630 [Rhodovulum sp. PH10]